jgi:hypothetical protein
MHRMKIHNWLPALLTSLAASACGVAGSAAPTPTPIAAQPGPPPPISTAPGEDFQLGYGQTARLDDGQLAVTFVEVDEDSRCPSDVECIWAGQVTIRVAVKVGEGEAQDVTLTLQPGTLDPASAMASLDGYTITLAGVEPYPVSTEAIGDNEYVATLRVSREG